MTENIISFKVAKLAKEKGFKAISRYGHEASLYDKDGTHVYYTNYGFMGSGLNDEYISAPTQSVLQKWLRDVHDIHVNPWCNASGWAWELERTNGTHISLMGIDDNVFEIEPESGMFKTYEEALEAGLQEALKLIKKK